MRDISAIGTYIESIIVAQYFFFIYSRVEFTPLYSSSKEELRTSKDWRENKEKSNQENKNTFLHLE